MRKDQGERMSFCTEEGLIRKSDDRESYRIWFEFLQRALRDKPETVNLEPYASWGDVKNQDFAVWWRRVGSKTTKISDETQIAFVHKGSATGQSYLLRIPKTLSTSAIVRQLKVLLNEARHTAQPSASVLRIRRGAEIRHQVFRAYLAVYDVYQQLSKNANGDVGKVSGQSLLKAVREHYHAKKVEYEGRVTLGPRRDPLPSALCGADTAIDKEDSQYASQAVATVLRYLRKSNEVLANVAKGRFPD